MVIIGQQVEERRYISSSFFLIFLELCVQTFSIWIRMLSLLKQRQPRMVGGFCGCLNWLDVLPASHSIAICAEILITVMMEWICASVKRWPTTCTRQHYAPRLAYSRREILGQLWRFAWVAKNVVDSRSCSICNFCKITCWWLSRASQVAARDRFSLGRPFGMQTKLQ